MLEKVEFGVDITEENHSELDLAEVVQSMLTEFSENMCRILHGCKWEIEDVEFTYETYDHYIMTCYLSTHITAKKKILLLLEITPEDNYVNH
jgi:hypothetical protein